MAYGDLVAAHLRQTQARIAEAAMRSGRVADSVRLVAVTKTLPVEVILAACAGGQREFGENRPEEGAEKIPLVAAHQPDCRPVWHMIGHIQRRKSPLVIQHFGMVHSVDRTELAERLSGLAVQAGRTLPTLMECNVSGESSKYGFPVSQWQDEPAALEPFVDAVRRMLALPGLSLQGLMTVAPWVADAEAVRPVFASLRALRDVLRERFPEHPWPHLSMGMSDDFEVAVEEGATLVRIGRAIFGERH